jgi:hypothetical protein
MLNVIENPDDLLTRGRHEVLKMSWSRRFTEKVRSDVPSELHSPLS